MPRRAGARTLVLAGHVGASHWSAFARDRRAEPDPLDRWAARALGAVAARFDAGCLARAACPVGAARRHPPDVARFHLAAFSVAVGR